MASLRVAKGSSPNLAVKWNFSATDPVEWRATERSKNGKIRVSNPHAEKTLGKPLEQWLLPPNRRVPINYRPLAKI